MALSSFTANSLAEKLLESLHAETRNWSQPSVGWYIATSRVSPANASNDPDGDVFVSLVFQNGLDPRLHKKVSFTIRDVIVDDKS